MSVQTEQTQLRYDCIGVGLLLACTLSGCGVLREFAPDATRRSISQQQQSSLARAYLPYAVLAASVYGTDVPTNLSKCAEPDSSECRRFLGRLAEKGGLGRDSNESQRETLDEISTYCISRGLSLSDARHGTDDAVGLSPACSPTLLNLPSTKSVGRDPQQSNEAKATDTAQLAASPWPKNIADCDADETNRPVLPFIDDLKLAGWQEEVQIERYALSRDWRLFVPGLGIEVWSRGSASRQPTVGSGCDPKHAPCVSAGSRKEYAIVFRGTADAGGWFSDFRLITALLPLVWDQYQQARVSAQQIVEQIRIQELAIWLGKTNGHSGGANSLKNLNDFNAIFPDITAVGHSLGAGLAKYVYYEVPEINRVVGFNPSPVDGSRTVVKVDDRPRIMYEKCLRRHAENECTVEKSAYPATDERGADMFFLFERGEFLTAVAPCISGSHWGNSGDPVSWCQEVDFKRTNWRRVLFSMFEQHSMGALTCRLALISK
ncbi:MAG TPA: hypothetical protein VFY73_18425 [Ideonella sp.]|uniref:hypothetical protein n=1 Tax=Ideonella sp. TaxID=1929293 RepID=UPI002E348811|nr:hypothetical protein [Ideonella sp.]HEX5686006.1 hypothetical protein [Ideonella sp.]